MYVICLFYVNTSHARSQLSICSIMFKYCMYWIM